MLQIILTTLVPVAFVVFLGYFAGRKSFSAADRVLLTKLVVNWLLPSLLLGGVLETPRADLLNYKIPLIFLVGILVPFLAVLHCVSIRFAPRPRYCGPQGRPAVIS